MASSFKVTIGYGISQLLTVTGSVDTQPPGLSGLYIKLFAEAGTQEGQPLLVDLAPFPAPVRVERRYELPPGAPLRVEVDTTAGSSAAPLAFTARTDDGRSADGTGLTNETIAVEIP